MNVEKLLINGLVLWKVYLFMTLFLCSHWEVNHIKCKSCYNTVITNIWQIYDAVRRWTRISYIWKYFKYLLIKSYLLIKITFRKEDLCIHNYITCCLLKHYFNFLDFQCFLKCDVLNAFAFFLYLLYHFHNCYNASNFIFKSEAGESQIMLNLLAAGIQSSSCYVIACSEEYSSCKHCFYNILFDILMDFPYSLWVTVWHDDSPLDY